MSLPRNTIGIVTLASTNAYPTELWLGANDCAAHLDLNLITLGSRELKQADEANHHWTWGAVEQLTQQGLLDGILLWTAGLLSDHTLAMRFIERYPQIPTVSLGLDLPGVHRVLMDGYVGMVKLITQLITDCSRRNIAFITGTPSNRDAKVRHRAYETALREQGLPLRPEYVVNGAFAWNSRAIGRQAVRVLLDQRGLSPDAIVASSDDLAIGALEELQRRGIRVPEAISVTGFDDIPDCTTVYPAITTVAQPAYQLAWRGVQMLYNLVQGQPTPECMLLPTEVVIRQSCGTITPHSTQQPLLTGGDSMQVELNLTTTDSDNNFLLEQLRARANQRETRIGTRTTTLFNSNVQMQAELEQRKQTELALAHARDLALETSRMKSEFLANMSHEIRTPMNGILGMAELLLETELDPEQRDFATVVQEEGQRLLEIINSILDFSKIEAGKLILEQVRFEPAKEVQSVLRLFATKAQAKGIALLSAIAPDLPQQVFGDATRFHQILVNLIGNAIKFTESGEVVVTLARAPWKDQAALSPDGKQRLTCQLTVRDTGIGIAETALPYLFTPFTQADTSTTRRFGGTGLGLSITKRLVELMGGEIDVISTPGAGSRFTVTIPFYGEGMATEFDGAIHPRTAIHYCLLVSDNARLQQLFSDYLANATIGLGFKHITGQSNAALLQLLYDFAQAGEPIQALIIDQLRTAVEPLTLARSLRADPLFAQLYLMLITPHHSPAAATKFKAAGIHDMLAQPVTQSAIHQCLMQHFAPGTALPASPDSPTAQTGVDTPTDHPLVLVAEDYENNQQVVLAHLKRLGYSAHVVENGQAAVDAVKAMGHKYQLILMDWQMPVMDGLAATREIRALEAGHGAHLPIIGVTASAIKGDRERCLAAGMDDYLSKPIQRAELSNVLTKWIAHSS